MADRRDDRPVELGPPGGGGRRDDLIARSRTRRPSPSARVCSRGSPTTSSATPPAGRSSSAGPGSSRPQGGRASARASSAGSPGTSATPWSSRSCATARPSPPRPTTTSRSEFAADERRHAASLASLVGNTRGEPVGRALARLQRGRAAGGNALRRGRPRRERRARSRTPASSWASPARASHHATSS